MTTGESDPTAWATGISVQTKIFPLAFLLLLFKTNVTIDGVTSVLPWGAHFFGVPPGVHEVRVSFRYLFSSTTGETGLKVEVLPDRTTTVMYRSPFIVFMGGSMRVVAP
jgi:hypothetical protein